MGSLYVNDFNRNGRTYRVQLQAEAEFRMRPEDLGKVYVRSQPTADNPNGNMIPLSSLSKVNQRIGAEQLERYNGLLSAKIFGSGAAGVSSGDAIATVERIAKDTLPEGYQIAWTGQAYQEQRTGNAALFAFGFAIVMVFLILAAQFETWALPLAVIMAVPFALVGALIAVLSRGMVNDIYFQIGLITLIGLAAKNAILIVEFASQKMEEGMPVAQAALEAARLRFRPIVMTSMAFVLGIVPLVVATGAGAGVGAGFAGGGVSFLGSGFGAGAGAGVAGFAAGGVSALARVGVGAGFGAGAGAGAAGAGAFTSALAGAAAAAGAGGVPSAGFGAWAKIVMGLIKRTEAMNRFKSSNFMVSWDGVGKKSVLSSKYGVLALPFRKNSCLFLHHGQRHCHSGDRPRPRR
jgi:hypothetical protein